MVSELERLKSDLEVLQRHQGYSIMENAIAGISDKIARLEAEADPWREEKKYLKNASNFGVGLNVSQTDAVVAYVDHLAAKVEAQRKQIDYLHAEYDNRGLQISELVADNDRLTKRVAELEAEKADAEEVESDYYNVSQAAKEANEAKHQDADPVLDPARVLATAEIALRARKWHETADNIKFIWQGIDLNAKPYRLKGHDEIEAKRQEMERTAWGQGS